LHRKTFFLPCFIDYNGAITINYDCKGIQQKIKLYISQVYCIVLIKQNVLPLLKRHIPIVLVSQLTRSALLDFLDTYNWYSAAYNEEANFVL